MKREQWQRQKHEERNEMQALRAQARQLGKMRKSKRGKIALGSMSISGTLVYGSQYDPDAPHSENIVDLQLGGYEFVWITLKDLDKMLDEVNKWLVV